MKKLILIILLTVITPGISQENLQTITVLGEANKHLEVDRYFLTISLKQIVSNGGQQVESKSLLQVEQIYKDKLKDIGVDFSKFQKSVLGQLYMAYSEENEVSYYNYVSTSEEEILKILKQRMNGLAIRRILVDAKEKTNEEWASLTFLAIEDAKMKAQKTADLLNKKLGEIIKIESSETKMQYIADTYRADEIQKHHVKVTFAIE